MMSYKPWLRLVLLLIVVFEPGCLRNQPNVQTTPDEIETHQKETISAEATSSASTEESRNDEIISTLAPINPADLKGITIQFWHTWFGEQGKLLQTLVDEFNLNNEFGIRIESIYQGNYNDLYQKIETAILSGVLPDLSLGYMYKILSWQNTGHVVTDLTPYQNDPNWGLTATEQTDFYPIFWEQSVINGARFGMPAQQFTQVMVYNRTWARQLGFETPPKTPKDFKEQVCAAAQSLRFDNDPQNDGTGGWVINTSPAVVLSWLYAFGSRVIHPSNSGYLFNTQPSHDALAFLKDLKDSGCAWQSNEPYAEAEFAQRRALMITSSIADLPYLERSLQQVGSRDEWTVLAFPSPIDQPVIVVYGPSFVVFQSTPERQIASWLFVRWLLSPENQARWIEVSSTLPTRASTTQELSRYASSHPQWATAVELLPYAQVEPSFPSWSVVRWAVSDVGTQVFRSYFVPERIPATLQLLDETAAELDESFSK
jgi:ABC-type glycerol-3-phosphate transport system substrate-binding protein